MSIPDDEVGGKPRAVVMNEAPVLRLDDIQVRSRSRTEARNIDGLVVSIRERGLLHPPVVRRDGDAWVLVAGLRRLAALRRLGRDETVVTVAKSVEDELAALRAEGEENTEREPFTPSEAVHLSERIGEVERALAKERIAEAGRSAAPGRTAERSGDSPDLSAGRSERESRTRTARAVGMSPPTLKRAAEVVKAAEDDSAPEPVREAARQAQADMDRSGKVEPAFQRLQAARAVEEARAVTDFLDQDQAIQDQQYLGRFLARLKAADDFLGFDTERLAPLVDEAVLTVLRGLARRVPEFVREIERHRSGLRVLKGGG